MDEGLREARRGKLGAQGAGAERSPGELKKNRHTVLIAAASLLVLLAAAGKFDWPSKVIHIDVPDRVRGTETIDAEQLVQAYHQDPEGAARRFRGREMVVTGEFLRLVPDGYGSLDMRLKTSNPNSPLGADLAQIAVDDARKLRPGDRVTLSCERMAGSGDERWLQQCAVQPAADEDRDQDEDEAIPAPPSPPAPPAPPPLRELPAKSR